MDTTKASATEHPPKPTDEESLIKLKERYRHELMDVELRLELRERISCWQERCCCTGGTRTYHYDLHPATS